MNAPVGQGYGDGQFLANLGTLFNRPLNLDRPDSAPG